jgi:TPR repeat protein
MTLSEIIRSITGAPPPPPPPPVETVDDGPVSPLMRDIPSADEFVALAEDAQKGDAEAQRKLGLIYYRGLGVEIDRAEAFKWFTLAADQGNLEAMQMRGLIVGGLDAGVLFEARCRVARFRGEPEPEMPSAVPDEAELRDNVFTTDATLTVEPEVAVPAAEPEEASEGFTVAPADRGATLAPAEGAVPEPPVFINPAAVMNGQPVQPAVNPAVWWWFWGIVTVVVLAIGVAVWLRPARSSAEVAFEPSPVPFKPAAIPGLVPEANPDGELAAASFQELTALGERGSVRAQYLVGLALAKGDGVPKDLAKAAEWYLRAAQRGDRDAQNNLGVFFIQGTGVEKDLAEAYKWFSLAADGGSRGAAKNREQLALMLSGEQIKEGSRRAAAFAVRQGR